MNVTSISVGLSGDDLISIVNEFVKIKELTIDKIEITDDIRIVGSFKKGITIKFEFKFKLQSMENGMINGEITGFKVLNIGIASFLRKVALKFALKSLKDKGIIYDKGRVVIQYKYLLKDVPFVDFDIHSIYFTNGTINVEVRNIKVSLEGKLRKEVELLEFKKPEVPVVAETEINKIQDNYSKGRIVVASKLPDKVKKYSDYIFVMPDIAALIYRLLKDKRVSVKTKLIISAAVAYIAVPCDIIPDKIPFVGKIDDIAIAVFALNVIMNEVPLNVVLDNWQGKNDIIVVLKTMVEYATEFTGAKNIASICNVIEEIVTV